MASLRFENVKKIYGDEVVIPSINFNIEDGDMVVVLGPSGCGKSTLLRMVAGLEDISEGAVYIDDQKINQVEPGDRNIAMVFQNYALYPHMNVYKNLAYGLLRRKLSKAEIKHRIDKVSQLLDIAHLLQRKPKALSGGQRQRVAMGRAIVRKPNLYLFDEPLSNLDANLRSKMRLEIRKIQQEFKTTTLYVTHDQVEAMTMADKIVLMNKGKIEQIGTPYEIYHEPKSKFVAAFMGSPPMNFLKAKMNATQDAVVLHGGTILPLAKTLHETYKNSQVILGMRPESITKATKTGVDTFELAVDMIEYLGGEKLVHGHFPGDKQTLTIKLPNKVITEVGEVLTLGIKPDSLYLFDKTSKKRL